MKHTLSILLQNESGALVRVAGLFAARNCNIDALTVAATHDPRVSQLTLVLHGDTGVLEQIVRQTRKLIDVIEVHTLTLVGEDRPTATTQASPRP
jgi:acetolactate synthase-1/3 small subunit